MHAKKKLLRARPRCQTRTVGVEWRHDGSDKLNYVAHVQEKIFANVHSTCATQNVLDRAAERRASDISSSSRAPKEKNVCMHTQVMPTSYAHSSCATRNVGTERPHNEPAHLTLTANVDENMLHTRLSYATRNVEIVLRHDESDISLLHTRQKRKRYVRPSYMTRNAGVEYRYDECGISSKRICCTRV
jgi:hypothetical protein